MLGAVAAVVDDDQERPGLPVQPKQQVGVGLAALVGPDPSAVHEGLVLDVQPDDLGVGKEVLPGAQGRPALALVLVAADPDLEHREPPVAELLEVVLVVLRVAVPPPLVRAVVGGQLPEVLRPRPGRPARGQAAGLPADPAVGRGDGLERRGRKGPPER